DEILDRLGDRGAAARRRRSTTSQRFGGPFIGRDDELERLLAPLHPPRQSAVIVLYGPSGVGKTELLERFAARAAREVPGTVALAGRCYEKESVPFKAVDGVVDARTRYLRMLSADQAAALLPRNAGVLAQVFPVLRRVSAFAESPHPRGDLDPRELQRRA